MMNHERLLWASDHPHSDATFPNSQQVLAEQTADLAPDVRDDIVWRNTARLYGLANLEATRRPDMAADLVIRGGTVVDGTGAPGVRADVAITGGKVSEIGTGLDGKAVARRRRPRRRARLHRHPHPLRRAGLLGPGAHPVLLPRRHHGRRRATAASRSRPTRPEHREVIARTLENVEDMNVASLAAGIPWDFSTFPEYLASVERRGTGLNYAAYIGHTALRLFVMGDAAYERVATPDEVARMQAVLREAMLAGAAGLATSFAITHRGVDGKPIPSRFADRAEFEALLDAMREVGRGRRRDRAG